MSEIKVATVSSAGVDVKTWSHLFIAGGNVKMILQLWKTFWEFLMKLNI